MARKLSIKETIDMFSNKNGFAWGINTVMKALVPKANYDLTATNETYVIDRWDSVYPQPTSQIVNEYLQNFFNVHHCIYKPFCCYKSDKLNCAPQRFKKFIKLEKRSIILIFSSRTAESFCDEILKYNLSNFCENKNVIVLSNNIKKKLDLINFNEIFVTSRPNLDSMIKSIELIIKKENYIE